VVINGSSDAAIQGYYGRAVPGQTVTISAPLLRDTQIFSRWQVIPSSVSLGDPYSPVTTFVMPQHPVIISARYESPPSPLITSAGSFTCTAGEGGNFQVTAIGPAPITYSLLGAPDGVAIDAAKGFMTISPALAPGVYSFSISVNNEVGTLQQLGQVFILTVEEAPLPPLMVPLFNVLLRQAAGGKAMVSAKNAEAETSITLSVSSVNMNNTFVRWEVTPAVTWTSGSATSKHATFVMPDSDVTIKPVYRYHAQADIEEEIEEITDETVDIADNTSKAAAVRDIQKTDPSPSAEPDIDSSELITIEDQETPLAPPEEGGWRGFPPWSLFSMALALAGIIFFAIVRRGKVQSGTEY